MVTWRTATFNWPDNRGTATALPLSAFGLSAFFFATLAGFAFGESIGGFLLLLSVGTLSLNTAAFFFVRLIPTNSSYVALPTREGRSRLARSAMGKLQEPRSGSSTERDGVRGTPDCVCCDTV